MPEGIQIGPIGSIHQDYESEDGVAVKSRIAAWDWNAVVGIAVYEPNVPADDSELREFYRLSNEVMRRKLAQLDEGETWKGDE